MLKIGKAPRNLTIFAALLVIAFAALSAGATASAAGVGVVDFVSLVEAQPETVAAKATLKAAFDQAEQEFADKSASMSPQEKVKYAAQLRQKYDEQTIALLNPIKDKVRFAIKMVADAKGLAMVVDIGLTIYGGEDITAEVGRTLNGK